LFFNHNVHVKTPSAAIGQKFQRGLPVFGIKNRIERKIYKIVVVLGGAQMCKKAREPFLKAVLQDFQYCASRIGKDVQK